MYECLKVAGATTAAALHRSSDFGCTAGGGRGSREGREKEAPQGNLSRS